MSEIETNEVPEVRCPQCNRYWPRVAEQGVVTDMLGRCYKCFLDEVVERRDELAKQAGYVVENCPDCRATEKLVFTCVRCLGKGWITTSKVKLH